MGEVLNIECSDEMTICEVFNIGSIVVISNVVNNTKTQLDVSGLITGEYILKIHLTRGGVLAGRMMIKK